MPSLIFLVIWLLQIRVFPRQINKEKIVHINYIRKKRATCIMLALTTEQNSNARCMKRGQNLWGADPNRMWMPRSLEHVPAFPSQKSYHPRLQQIE